MQREMSYMPVEKGRRIEAAIVSLLLDAPLLGVWSVNELVGELGSGLAVEDGLASLCGVGLVHRLGELVFPTQALIRSGQLIR